MTLTKVGLGVLVAAASLFGARASATSNSQQSPNAQHATEQASAKGAPKQRSTSGDVKSIDAKALTLSNDEQFRLTGSTQFDRNGHAVHWKDVKPGDHVKASYEPRGKLAYADRIDIVPSATGPSAAAGNAKPSESGNAEQSSGMSSDQKSSNQQQGTGSATSSPSVGSDSTKQ